MVKSIRWRLQLWYTVILLGVIFGFAALLFFRVQSDRLGRVDQELEATARYLDATLRGLPPHELDRLPPKGPPPKISRERLIAELRFPGLPEGGPLAPEGAYFAIWKRNRELFKASDSNVDRTYPLSSLQTHGLWKRSSDRHEFLFPGPRNSLILVGKSIHFEQAELRRFGWQLALSGVTILALGLTGGWFLSGRILRPIQAIAATASRISSANLEERIASPQMDRELRPLAEVLNQTFARLKDEFERQARFTADASHELRTPLSVLYSLVEYALLRKRSAEEYEETLQSCKQAALRMRSLIDALLMLARTDRSGFKIQQQKVNLSAILEEAGMRFRTEMDQKAIILSRRLPAEPLQVSGDATLLSQIIDNLLSNAIRHSSTGGELILEARQGDGEVEFAVIDHGEGIAAEHLPHLFERFYRVDAARSRASGGSGLGLAICKRLVELHGGRIVVESTLGQGSTFRVFLPSFPSDDRTEAISNRIPRS